MFTSTCTCNESRIINMILQIVLQGITALIVLKYAVFQALEKIVRVYVNATSGYATLDLAVQNTMVWCFLTQMNMQIIIVKTGESFSIFN